MAHPAAHKAQQLLAHAACELERTSRLGLANGYGLALMRVTACER